MNKLLDDTKLSNKAAELFWQDYNCAQSVVVAYSDVLNIDKETAINLSCGLGGGMGRLQETCGAVSAAYMIFGLANADSVDNPDKVAKTYAMVQEFHKRFTQVKGTTVCKTLINCDLNTEEGQGYFKSNNLKKDICEGCIRDSVKLINAIIGETTED
ncbi:C-GCAxxG-C-C family protein [uncultured Draconibacterium sp.]|uniref:C-GCAxxG-C-C family protein n=1 Tax=uncultured Draconibacterium sp. TaxID=1573823 RepID=UPI0025FEE9DF|nr:C-GCAxxG-C-C family protein [uncultured Draconibacterium sp.]